MSWTIQTYDELTTDELYKIIQLRVNVFIVEQQTCYEDLDIMIKTLYIYHM